MTRKVFISILGTGIYEKCTYVSNDFKSSETKFIQQATMEFLGCSSWPENSHAYILLTDKARTDNWEVANNERYDSRKEKTIHYTGLLGIIKAMNLPFKYDDISIPNGKDADEMWTIFETLYSLLEEGDELYFDLTHSFRYLPMLMLVFGNYAKLIKKATVKSITYGNWEARNNEKNEAPIVDLMPLSSLQDWTFATADYIKNGYTERLASLSQKEISPFLRNTETRTEQVKLLSKVISNIKRLAEERLTCRGLDVVKAKTSTSAAKNLSSLSNVVISALRPVIDKLREASEANEKSNDIANMFAAARWCKNHNLDQQAVTFLEEGIISFFCEQHNIEIDDDKRRGLVTSAFYIKENNTPKEEQRVTEEDRPILESLLTDKYLNDPVFVHTVSDLINFRNDYNHCGMRKNRHSVDSVLKKTEELITTIVKRLNMNRNINIQPKHIFLNLSNHPSSDWGEAQMAAAREYGDVVDEAFPDVKPELKAKEVAELADNTVAQIISKYNDCNITVHVMGEMTLTYAIVERMKTSGITCVASTTQRVATMHDNKKTSEFTFAGFREY